MPMAGNGVRTRDLGKFKPFIFINNKSIIEWFLISILDKVNKDDEFVFITTQAFNDEFVVKDTVSKLFKKYKLLNNINFRIANHTPQGPAKSIELGIEYIKDKTLPIIIINVDQFILFNLPNIYEEKCYLVSNIDIGSSKSYIEVDKKQIVKIIEKVNNSNIASAGVYIFPNLYLLNDALNYLFTNNIKYEDEFYIANAMNFLIGKVEFELIPVIAKFDLGTVDSINYFRHVVKLIKGE
jgi:dTDP-glucose pyrophosphorylase